MDASFYGLLGIMVMCGLDCGFSNTGELLDKPEIRQVSWYRHARFRPNNAGLLEEPTDNLDLAYPPRRAPIAGKWTWHRRNAVAYNQPEKPKPTYDPKWQWLGIGK